MGFRVQLDVVAPRRGEQPFPGEGVLLSEPMLRFRCNERGCCCSHWDIPFRLEDFLRLHEHLDEQDRAQLTKKLRLILEPPPRGQAIDEGEQRLHSLKLLGVGDDKHCRFLAGDGGCGVHRKYGTEALPDLCVDFPAFGYRHAAAPAELFFDPVCPEVLERLDESDEPLRLHHQPASFDNPMHDLRARHASTPVRAAIGGDELSPVLLFALRTAAVAAFARPRPAWRSLFALLHGLRELRASDEIPPSWPADPPDAGPLVAFLHRALQTHSDELLLQMFRRARRFLLAPELAPLWEDPERLRPHLVEWQPALGRWFAPEEEKLQPLCARWLAHRFAFPWVKQRAEVRQAADAIAHLYATALRYAAALGAALERPVDRSLMKTAIGASEFFYRSLHLPLQALPWYAWTPSEAPGPA